METFDKNKTGSERAFPNDGVAVLDCTIRDGGAITNSRFDDKTVRAVYDACADAGIDYMEIGYKNGRKFFDPEKYGKWRFCDEDSIKKIVGDNPRPIKIAAMFDVGKCEPKLPKKSDSPVDLIRVATYAKDLPAAIDIVKYAADLGYETSVNIMAISTLSERGLNLSFESAAESRADIVYVMDSFGGLDGRSLRRILAKCKNICAEKRVGVHIHNNLQLAFADTIEAVENGADIVDCTLCGLGRGAGNCRTELLAGYLKRLDMRPILECAQNFIEPLRGKYSWGFDHAYMATGLFGKHPSAAIEYGKSQHRPSLADFYDSVANS